MYYEEKLENGIRYCRTAPDGEWVKKPYQGEKTGIVINSNHYNDSPKFVEPSTKTTTVSDSPFGDLFKGGEIKKWPKLF